jgi:hypothetical protein
MANKINYREMILLDAEDLAETGIAEAYRLLLPKLRQFVSKPLEIEESFDSDKPRYAVRCGGKEYIIYSPELDDSEGDSWGRATFALFSIVNDQLAGSTHRFYAINGGNDLGGMFLTPAEVEDAKLTPRRKTDWPYIPQNKHPWYGQPHEDD